MARGINKVFLIGNLGADPELRHTKAAGTPFCRMSLATNESYTSSASGEKKEVTQWHAVMVWKKQAENCAQYLKKGSPLFVEGRLATRSWTDNDGNQRYVTEIHAREVQFLGGNQGNGRAMPPEPNDDDIPF